MNNLGEARRAYQDTLESGHFTQEDLADYVGIGLGAVKNWEQGKTQGIKSRHLLLMADKYGVSVDYLLGRTDNPSPAAAPRGLDDAVAELLDCYHKLGSDGRTNLVKLARSMVKGNEYDA